MKRSQRPQLEDRVPSEKCVWVPETTDYRTNTGKGLYPEGPGNDGTRPVSLCVTNDVRVGGERRVITVTG